MGQDLKDNFLQDLNDNFLQGPVGRGAASCAGRVSVHVCSHGLQVLRAPPGRAGGSRGSLSLAGTREGQAETQHNSVSIAATCPVECAPLPAKPSDVPGEKRGERPERAFRAVPGSPGRAEGPRAPPPRRRGGMAWSARWVLCLCLGWGCLCLALGDALRPRRLGLRRRAAPGAVRAGRARAPAGEDGAGQRRPGRPAAADRVAEHMLRLYEQYRDPPTPAGPWLRRGNTVRGFRPLPSGSPEGLEVYVFNLTSLTESENVLSASVYYYIGDLLHVKWNCSQPSGCSHHQHRKPEIQIHLSVWTFPSAGSPARSLGRFLINVSSAYQDVLSWQWKDITQLLHEAKQNNELLISVKMDLPGHHPWERVSSSHEPYILIYANDSAISEPESVVSTLRGHRHPLARVLPKPQGHRRRRRSASVLLPLQNNELPGAQYQYREEQRWEGTRPYKTFQPQLTDRARSKKKQRKSHLQKSQTLQFDEQTLKKARRKQWNEPRSCARRYLKVDFADIGWSEWIISPKSFDAYYCSGECQFPIPKAMKPSNHATIQSIVRAVGVVPGIPEPCCVPDKMSSLSILFFDENKNVVLKVYPNMTVESCACR